MDTTVPSPAAPKITVVGTGYLGATHAICMAVLGFDVLGVDVDERKIAQLRAGKVPFFEPGCRRSWTRPSPPAACTSPRTSTRPPRSATCTSSASGRRRPPTPPPRS